MSTDTVDLVIRNGLIVDGTGRPAYRGDVAIARDRIVSTGLVSERGRTQVDATGMVVAPGFIDAHTHMDAQLFWDDLGTSACWHGVTTVITGNCGFTLAPARPHERSLVACNIERAEDISREAINQGVDWSWETFSGYLDAVESVPKGLNYAASIGHSALRIWAMGERAFEEAAQEVDLEVMAEELRSALRSGAAGFTTSRGKAHLTSDGRPVASRQATWDEVTFLTEIVGRESAGVFQLAPDRSFDPAEQARFDDRLCSLAVSTGVPIVFGLFATSTLPQPSLDLINRTVDLGGDMYALTHCRGVVSAQSFRTRLGFDSLPQWAELRSKPLEDQRRLLQDGDVRRRLIYEAQHGSYARTTGPEAGRPDFEAMRVLRSAYLPNPTVLEEAVERGVAPVEAMIDIALEDGFDTFFVQDLMAAQDETQLLQLMAHPRTAMGFSDSGAHVSQIFDSSIFTHLLAYWVRERQALSLESAVQMMTSQPANIWRLHERGRLQPGYAADVVVFDPGTVAPLMPRAVSDLPGGGTRIEQRATGLAATIVNGEVVIRGGVPARTASR